MIQRDTAALEEAAIGALPGWQMTTPCGARLRATAFGGHLCSWAPKGLPDLLFLSELAQLDGSAPIRGGAPIIFPQFNTRGNGPKHGFARSALWTLDESETSLNAGRLALKLSADAKQAVNDHTDYDVYFTATATNNQLQLTLKVAAQQAMVFGACLHTYFAVNGPEKVTLGGLEHSPYWDALTNQAQAATHSKVSLGVAIDRIYESTGQTLHLTDAHHELTLAQSGFDQTVVWNPGPDAVFKDMQRKEWAQFICVEPATVDPVIALQAGQVWTGTQTISVAQVAK